MATKTTRWSPDTCKCVIEYTWDTDVSESTRTHSVSKIVKACPDHSAVIDANQHFSLVNEENTRKNKVYQLVIDTFPALTETITNPEGNSTVLLTIPFNYQYNASRILEIDLPGLTLANKTTLQSAVDSQIGENKVSIV